MNIYRLHRGVGRAVARVSGIDRRTTSTRVDTFAGHWTIPSVSNPGAVSHGADWRRLLLEARGEQIHVTSVQRSDRCAIAILDATGMVICWHDTMPRARPYDPGVLNRHMSQFYLADEIALHVPARHLSIAAEYGVDTQRGWRRRPVGEIFWGVTILQSILSDGEVLGYSHVTRCLRAPAQQLARPLRATTPGIAAFAQMA